MNSLNQTTPFGRNAVAFLPFSLPVVTVALSIGTGGQYTNEYHKQQLRLAGLPSDQREVVHGGYAVNTLATTADEIARIKSILKLTVRELSECLGVSRQAVYNWKSGTHIKNINAEKLENLKQAANVISDANAADFPLLLRRKLDGGKTLLEIVSADGDGTQAARYLVKMLQSEAEQRKALDREFAGRKIPVRNSLGY